MTADSIRGYPRVNQRRSASYGQSTLEYAVFIAAVAAAVVSMSLYVRRGIMANLKLLECQIQAEALSNTGGVGCDAG